MRLFRPGFCFLALKLIIILLGGATEITGFRSMSPGKVELTFTSEAGALYDICQNEDGSQVQASLQQRGGSCGKP